MENGKWKTRELSASGFPIKQRHISCLQRGDTVLLGGVEYTVGKNDVSNGFTGWCLRGDPHPLARGMVDIVDYPNK